MIVPARPLTDHELLALSAARPGWHIEREIQVVSEYASYASQRRRTLRYVEQGARYGVVIDPEWRRFEEFGDPPDGLHLDIDRIIEAGAGRAAD